MSQSPKTFELFIEDPKTDLEKVINGKVIISSIGSKKNSIGELSGFSDGKTIKVGPTGETLTEDLNILVNEVILILIDQVISEYNIDLTGRLKSIGPVLEAVEITPTTNQNVGTTGSTASEIKVSNEIILNDITFNIDINGKIKNDKLGTLKIIEKLEPITSGFDFGDELDLSLLDDEFTESQFEGNEESFNEITDEPSGVNEDEGFTSPLDPNSKLLSKSSRGDRYYIVDSSNGLAGKRLRNIMSELESYLSKKYPGTKIGFNGVMRDLVASTYPNSPARAVASLHGAGLAIDVTFMIPGKKWTGIGDNENLASDEKLSKLIYEYVKSQGDITWGGQWGAKDGTKPEEGTIRGWGITEYHHFEIKASKILDYWKPFKDEIVSLGINFDKLNKYGRGSELEKLNKILLRSVNITA
jgi:hypothetical protein